MGSVQYPWPDAQALRATTKQIGRHKRGSSGGERGVV